ncbi:MAG: hypothetical protein WBP33_03520 [Saprospiraceae bacterium]
MRPGHTPYHYVQNNPINRIDPDGAFDTDYLNSETGQTLHVEDGINQIAVVNNDQFKLVQTLASADSWNQEQTQQYDNILNSSQIHSMDSDLGILSRLTYAEMEGGNDNAKAIVAESAVNRTERPEGSYENPNGTLSGAINKKGAYDVTNPKSNRNDEFTNPYPSANSRASKMGAWLSSIKAAYNAINGSDVGKGTIFYNSNSSTFYDKNTKMEKVNLNVTHTGIKGTWKLK